MNSCENVSVSFSAGDALVDEASAELFRALGHPILQLLLDTEQPVSSLLASTGLKPSAPGGFKR